MNIKPLLDRVVIEQTESSNKTKSGLHLPESAQEKSQEGIVVAMGEGRWSEFHGKFYPSLLKLDDRVIFSKHAGTEVTEDGKKYMLLNERDVLAVLESATD